jgi:hypothetical protein
MSLAYYERLAPWYRLIYADWDASAARRAGTDVARSHVVRGGRYFCVQLRANPSLRAPRKGTLGTDTDQEAR